MFLVTYDLCDDYSESLGECIIALSATCELEEYVDMTVNFVL